MSTFKKLPRTREFHLTQRARVEYRTAVLNPDGSTARISPWRKNLIMDAGLDMVGARSWVANFAHAKIGTGVGPTSRDSAAVTFSRAGTTVTASAGFFISSDVGRLLKFDSGAEMYITVFTNATTVTVGTSGVLGASQGTVWYVNETALGVQVKDTNTYGSDSGDNGSTFSVDTSTHKRTFIFSPEGGAIAYTEAGWGFDNGTAIFGRTRFVAPEALTAGQQFKIIVRLIVTFSPATPTAAANVGTNGFDTTGQITLERNLGYSQEFVATSGATTSFGGPMPHEPSMMGGIQMITAVTTLGSMAAGEGGGGAGSSSSTATTSPGYAGGSFTQTREVTFQVTDVNSASIHAVAVVNTFQGSRGVAVLFDNPQTKDSDHTLRFVFRWSWQRELVN